MAASYNKMNVLLEVVDKGNNFLGSQNVNYQKVIDPPNQETACKKCGREQSGPDLICTEPIPMKITCVHKCEEDGGPVGRITRNQHFDLIGGKLVYRCTCATRNGLDPDCKRVACQSNPGCKMKPPRCWPQYRPKPETRREIEGPIRLCFYYDDATSEAKF